MSQGIPRCYICRKFGHVASDCVITYSTVTGVVTEEPQADCCIDGEAKAVGINATIVASEYSKSRIAAEVPG